MGVGEGAAAFAGVETERLGVIHKSSSSTKGVGWAGVIFAGGCVAFGTFLELFLGSAKRVEIGIPKVNIITTGKENVLTRVKSALSFPLAGRGAPSRRI